MRFQEQTGHVLPAVMQQYSRHQPGHRQSMECQDCSGVKQMISNDKKAVIHIAKAQVGMDDNEYRDLLGSVGVKSSVGLNNKTFSHVMTQFKKLGFKSKSKTRASRKINSVPKEKKQLMRKLEAIILDMDLTWNYVDAIARSRFKVDAVQWLNSGDLYKLVQMMVIHQKRNLKVRPKRRG